MILENIDIDIDIDMVILENIDIDIDIDKAILQNIDIDKISNRFKFGISNRARPMQFRSGGGGIVVQKWREGGVSVNTFYFTILFRNCCESGVNLLWDCIESVQKM